MKRFWLVPTVVFLLALCALSESLADSLSVADRVIIRKSERRLYLEKEGQVFREFTVSLGKNPVGHKQRRGDQRTPEGSYVIDYRIAESKFYKALHVSYPNRDDLRAARSKGFDPGGLIMIHGLPKAAQGEEEDYIQRDWTDGCIAVANGDMDQIWNLVKDGTPVDILP